MNSTRADAPFSISVIVPNYNDAQYLTACIESIINQDTPPDELIILDDASTDNSREVIRNAIAGCPFARLICHPKNLGGKGVGNSNYGLSVATGKFIFFLGANDLVLPGFFTKVRNILTQYPEIGLWSAMVKQVDEDGHFIRLYPSPVISLSDRHFSGKECIRNFLSIGSWLTGQTTVYRREALVEAGGFDAELGGLCDLISAQVVASRYGAVFSPLPLGIMRIHRGAFLVSTLSEPHLLKKIITRVNRIGPVMAPELFTPCMLSRIRSRLYFASLRLSCGKTTPAIAPDITRMQRQVIKLIDALPPSFSWLRTPSYFLTLRSKDLSSAIWYRGIGFLVISAGLRFRSKHF